MITKTFYQQIASAISGSQSGVALAISMLDDDVKNLGKITIHHIQDTFIQKSINNPTTIIRVVVYTKKR